MTPKSKTVTVKVSRKELEAISSTIMEASFDQNEHCIAYNFFTRLRRAFDKKGE